MERICLALKLTLLLVSLTLGTVSCSHKEDDNTGGVFNVTHPWRQSVTITRQYVAQIKAIQHIEIRAFEKGYLQKIFVDEGQLIRKGTKMFQIMPFLMKAEYEKAHAEYNISKIEYDNTKSLADKEVVSQNELALAKARFQKSSAMRDLAKTHLDLTTIIAPFDGIMDRFRVRLGSLVEEGELLTTLSDISKLWVYFNMSEKDYLNYVTQKKEKGDSAVQLILANGKPYDYPGHIDTIEADFDNETGTVPLRATVPNPKRLLRHGETGNILLSQALDNALIIPQKSTFEVVEKRYVYVVNDEGVIDAREVAIDNEIPQLFIIKSGISEKDTVVLDGIGKLSKGKKIKIKLLTKSEALKGVELHAE